MILAFFNTLRIAKLIEGVLATAGGFLVGYILVMIIGWLIDKYIMRRKSPEFLHTVCRTVGGLIVAILVAMMVFGGGGGDGDGIGDGVGLGSTNPPEPSPTPPAEVKPVVVETKPVPRPDERIVVTMLGGTDVKDQRFYILEGDMIPHTFEEIQAVVQERKAASKQSLGLEIRFTTQNTLPQDHPAVVRLAKWARETAGLTVTFPAEMP